LKNLLIPQSNGYVAQVATPVIYSLGI